MTFFGKKIVIEKNVGGASEGVYIEIKKGNEFLFKKYSGGDNFFTINFGK